MDASGFSRRRPLVSRAWHREAAVSWPGERVSVDAEELDQRLEAAVSIAEAAGPIALGYFRSPLAVDDKSAGGAFDPVTAADREIERQMREQIAARYPEDGIYGEEEGERTGASGLR